MRIYGIYPEVLSKMALSCPNLFSNLSLMRLCIRTKIITNGYYSHHLSCFSRFVLYTRYSLLCCPSQLILLVPDCVLCTYTGIYIFFYYKLNMSHYIFRL